MLSAQSLSARDLFANLSLTLHPGTIHGLSGPSGGGKTTLGRILAGLDRPSGGTVLLNGTPLPDCGRSPVQYLHQSPLLAMNPRWTIRQVLAEPDPAPTPDIPESWLNLYPHQLSGGQLQRVAIARALKTRPSFLIADEITAALDPIAQAQVWATLRSRCDQGLGILAISHDAALLGRIAETQTSLIAPPTPPDRP